MKTQCELPVVVLVAMSERTRLHRERTLPSLLGQDSKWDFLYVVDDVYRREGICGGILATAGMSNAKFIKNNGPRGAAGAWNSGLEEISSRFNEAWIAILDDDDIWDANHISACRSAACDSVDAVVSGIGIMYKHFEVNAFSRCFDRKEFLYGNPGWQGSNTFVRLSRINECGRFDLALPCTHDRDLALRLLNLPNFRYARTGQRTVWYMMDPDVPAYTRPGNPVKLAGLRAFLHKYKHEMKPEDLALFLERSSAMFGFSADNFSDLV